MHKSNLFITFRYYINLTIINIMFKNDLIEGQKAEKKLAEILEKRGYEVIHNEGTTLKELRRWDLLLKTDAATFSFEVKWDKLSGVTGNVAIEIKCLGYSSADYFVYLLGERFYCIATSKLKALVKTAEGKFVYGGDGKRELLKLIKLTTFINHSNEIY